MAMTDDEVCNRFPVGYHDLHPNVALNFQLNRFYGWANDGQMLKEMQAAAPRIASHSDWIREMLVLSDSALAAGRVLSAAYYSRSAHFFLDPDDPRYGPALRRFLHNVVVGLGVTDDEHYEVPYRGTRLSAYRFTPARPRGTVMVFRWIRQLHRGMATCGARAARRGFGYRDLRRARPGRRARFRNVDDSGLAPAGRGGTRPLRPHRRHLGRFLPGGLLGDARSCEGA